MSIVGLVMVVLMIPVKLSGKNLVPFKARPVWMSGAHNEFPWHDFGTLGPPRFITLSFHGNLRGPQGPVCFPQEIAGVPY